MGIEKKVGSLGLSLLMAVTPVGAVADEVTVNPLIAPETINIKGAMTSQKEIALTDQKEIQTNQRVGEYLNNVGSCSDEELTKRTFYFYDSLSKADLGFCGVDSNNILVQGILLGHFQKNDRDFLMVGVKDVAGKRKVSVIEWLINETMDAYSCVPVLKMDGYYNSASFEVEKMPSKEAAMSFLESKMGDVVVFNLYNLNEKKVSKKEYQDLDEKKLGFYLNYIVPRWQDSINFVSGLLKPSFKKLKTFVSEVNFIKSLKEKELFSVSSYDEAINMSDSELNSTPLLSIIQYNTNLR